MCQKGVPFGKKADKTYSPVVLVRASTKGYVKTETNGRKPDVRKQGRQIHFARS